VIDGSFDFLIEKLRSGEIDFIIGPVRGLDSSLGVIETVLFDDSYALVVRRGHPLTLKRHVRLPDLLAYDWIEPPPAAPRRIAYDALFARLGRHPRSTIQTSSTNLTRAILTETDCVSLVSRFESQVEQEMGLLTVLPFVVPHPARQVQVTTRADWLPTAVQARFLTALHDQAGGLDGVKGTPRTASRSARRVVATVR
jgi:LysR family transcriptional regulator of gallate degradation